MDKDQILEKKDGARKKGNILVVTQSKSLETPRNQIKEVIWREIIELTLAVRAQIDNTANRDP